MRIVTVRSVLIVGLLVMPYTLIVRRFVREGDFLRELVYLVLQARDLDRRGEDLQ